jgi:hypothetical protein
VAEILNFLSHAMNYDPLSKGFRSMIPSDPAQLMQRNFTKSRPIPRKNNGQPMVRP